MLLFIHSKPAKSASSPTRTGGGGGGFATTTGGGGGATTTGGGATTWGCPRVLRPREALPTPLCALNPSL